MKTFQSSFEGRENIKKELLILSEKVGEYSKGLKVETHIPWQNLKVIKTKLQSYDFVFCETDGYNYALHSFFQKKDGDIEHVEVLELSIDVL